MRRILAIACFLVGLLPALAFASEGGNDLINLDKSLIIQAVNFLILAFIIFMMVKQINRLKKAEPAPPPAETPENILLLREIRDSLKK